MVKRFSHIEGINYNEVFTLVVKHDSTRILLSAVVNFDMDLEEMDVKTAFYMECYMKGFIWIRQKVLFRMVKKIKYVY